MATLLVMFPVGFFIMFTEFGRQYIWTTTIFLGLQAVILVLVMIKLADPLSVIITTSAIIIVSYFTEWWGVNTGIPFGFYNYTSVLQPQISGVPLAIVFAWIAVASSSFLGARSLLKTSGGLTVLVVSSVFILATDLLLEPFASFINNYWVWQGGMIPVQNFVSWLIIGLVFSIMLGSLIKWRPAPANESSLLKIPLIIIAINVVNFSVMNFVHGYIVITILGLSIFAVMMLSSIKLRIK